MRTLCVNWYCVDTYWNGFIPGFCGLFPRPLFYTRGTELAFHQPYFFPSLYLEVQYFTCPIPSSLTYLPDFFFFSSIYEFLCNFGHITFILSLIFKFFKSTDGYWSHVLLIYRIHMWPVFRRVCIDLEN